MDPQNEFSSSPFVRGWNDNDGHGHWTCTHAMTSRSNTWFDAIESWNIMRWSRLDFSGAASSVEQTIECMISIDTKNSTSFNDDDDDDRRPSIPLDRSIYSVGHYIVIKTTTNHDILRFSFIPSVRKHVVGVAGLTPLLSPFSGCHPLHRRSKRPFRPLRINISATHVDFHTWFD